MNNRHLIKKPVRSIRQHSDDDQLGPAVIGKVRTVSGGVQTAISVMPGPGSLSICGQPTRSQGTQLITKPHVTFNDNAMSSTPNATIVVCVLAGTGRADLWVRNNRGQTPLDLCPADQPLRRALIKCCDAAARARSAHGSAAAAATDAVNFLPSEQWPHQSHLQLRNMSSDYSMVAPSNNVYASMIAGDPSKECSKTLDLHGNPDILNIEVSSTHSMLDLETQTPTHVTQLNNNDPTSPERGTDSMTSISVDTMAMATLNLNNGADDINSKNDDNFRNIDPKYSENNSCISLERTNNTSNNNNIEHNSINCRYVAQTLVALIIIINTSTSFYHSYFMKSVLRFSVGSTIVLLFYFIIIIHYY